MLKKIQIRERTEVSFYIYALWQNRNPVSMEHIVIIGNGIAGVTAARHIRKGSDHRISLISSESEHFFSRTALMYVYMGHMTFDHTKPYGDHFWKKNRIDLLHAHVVRVDPRQKKVWLDDASSLNYDRLILATGSRPNKLDRPGEDLLRVQGLYSKQDLELLEKNARDNKRCRRAVIVGGGLIGIELAEMLRSRQIPVTFLVRENSFFSSVLPQGDSAMVTEHIRQHHIDLRLNARLAEILPDGKGRARAVVLEGSGEEIPCDLVGLTAGVSPNIGFLKNSGIALDRGVLVNRYFETNCQGVYAIGDCAQQKEPLPGRKAIEPVWYTGRIMGETLARTLCGQPSPYSPGPWFNSAKFLDIEYQTYGQVVPEFKKHDSEIHFHWRHPREKICLTLAFDRTTETFLGINALGIRLRHGVVEGWLKEKRKIDTVMETLADANFDTEFEKHWEATVLAQYNSTFSKSLRPGKRKPKNIFQRG